MLMSIIFLRCTYFMSSDQRFYFFFFFVGGGGGGVVVNAKCICIVRWIKTVMEFNKLFIQLYSIFLISSTLYILNDVAYKDLL